jgi:DNA repair photolyase
LSFPVFIIEKSDLVLRDLDLLEKINKKTGARITFSIITTKDDEVRQLSELGASSVSRQFKALKEFSRRSRLTVVALVRILSFIYDDEERLEGVVRAAW